MDFCETILSSKLPQPKSLLLIQGLLPRKPVEDAKIGKAWVKRKRNGRVYYKLKFDCFVGLNGKPWYVKGWSRKLELSVFDIYAEEKPAWARYPLFLDKAGGFCFRGKPSSDGSVDLLMDHSFLAVD